MGKVMEQIGRDMYQADELQKKEAEFFDSVASARSPNLSRAISSESSFPHVTPAGNRFLHEFLGSLKGKRVLDVRCGAGYVTVLLAKKGGKVTAFDISERYLEMAKERIRVNGVENQIEWIGKMGAEKIEFPDESFDVIFGGHVLHHTKIECSVPEIARVLKPGGIAAFVETLGTNPVFSLLRRHVSGHFGIPRLRNETEYPLRGREISFIAGHFGSCALRGDVLFSMAYEYVFKNPKIGRALQQVDGFVFSRAPWLARTAYCGILTLRK